MHPPERGRQLSLTEGDRLIRTARQAISKRLDRPLSDTIDENGSLPAPDDPLSGMHFGTFVTLTIDGQLRGCIGNFDATEPLTQSVRKNAINAAFRDPRFPPLTDAELDCVRIEISILTPPEPLDYRDEKALLEKLTPGIDGVIIRKGAARATFLPQVWSQLKRPEDFLTHLCIKAGLPADVWRREPLDVEIYRVQSFEEAAAP